MSDVMPSPPASSSVAPSSGASLTVLLRRWQEGWVRARGFGPAEEVGGALRVPVFGQGRRWEFLVPDPDGDSETVRELAGEVAGSPARDWLTVATGAPDTVALVMHRAGLRLSDGEEFLMTRGLADQPVAPPPGPYRVSAEVEGPVVRVRVLAASGEEAAGGVMAVAGSDAVADRIMTDPAHRRRGLGRVVMGALVERALEMGARDGLLVASVEGRHLYASLGWRVRANVVIGATPAAEPVEAPAGRGGERG